MFYLKSFKHGLNLYQTMLEEELFSGIGFVIIVLYEISGIILCWQFSIFS